MSRLRRERESAQDDCLPLFAGNEMRMVKLSSMEQLVVGKFGIMEPPLSMTTESDPTLLETPLDLLVVPGMAFDHTGARLGRGRGYYDRYISHSIKACEAMARPPPYLVGLCVETQLVPEVPIEGSDRLLDALATPLPPGSDFFW